MRRQQDDRALLKMLLHGKNKGRKKFSFKEIESEINEFCTKGMTKEQKEKNWQDFKKAIYNKEEKTNLAPKGCRKNKTRSTGSVSSQRWLAIKTWQQTWSLTYDCHLRAAEAGAERLLRQTLGIGRLHSHRADRVS